MPAPRADSVTCISPGGLHEMAYVEWGDRDNPRVLVCVHGLTRTGRDFDVLARAFATTHRVVCPDIVGRGRSGRLRDPAGYVVPQYVSDCITLVARLGVPKVDWLGTSMGGLIGMGLASLPGNPIANLVLNDIGPVLERKALVRIADYVGQKMRFTSFAEAERYVRFVHMPFGEHTDAEWKQIAENVLVPDGDGVRMSYDEGMVPAFRTLADSVPVGQDLESWPVYDAITARTLVVRGEKSDLLSTHVHAMMGERGPRAELVTIPKVGHAPTFMHEDQLAILRAFLR